MSSGRYHWSHVSHPARLWKINAVAFLPLLALLLHPSWFTLWLALGVCGFLLYIEVFKKINFEIFLRYMNVWLTGRLKTTGNAFKKLLFR